MSRQDVLEILRTNKNNIPYITNRKTPATAVGAAIAKTTIKKTNTGFRRTKPTIPSINLTKKFTISCVLLLHS